jgi:hypothetical protein
MSLEYKYVYPSTDKYRMNVWLGGMEKGIGKDCTGTIIVKEDLEEESGI